MKTLKFNDMNLILEWIREPSHKEHLFILEAAIAKANQTSLDQFSVGTKVVKCNPKKAVVMEEGRGKWTVPYSLMKLAA